MVVVVAVGTEAQGVELLLLLFLLLFLLLLPTAEPTAAAVVLVEEVTGLEVERQEVLGAVGVMEVPVEVVVAAVVVEGVGLPHRLTTTASCRCHCDTARCSA